MLPSPETLIPRLFRIQLDDEALVDVLTEFRTVRRALEGASHLFHIDLDPRWKADLLGQLKRVDDAQLSLGAVLHRDHVARLHQRGGNVHDLPVDRDGAVRYELPCFTARRTEPHPIYDVIEPRFEQLEQILAGRALAPSRRREIALELPL